MKTRYWILVLAYVILDVVSTIGNHFTIKSLRNDLATANLRKAEYQAFARESQEQIEGLRAEAVTLRMEAEICAGKVEILLNEAREVRK